jgi:hypothetical protein
MTAKKITHAINARELIFSVSGFNFYIAMLSNEPLPRVHLHL